MKVSLGAIGLCIILAFFLYFAWYGKNVYEIITRPDTNVKEGFEVISTASGIRVTTCPKKFRRYINDRGFTMCCDGQLESNTCHGDAVCSLSESAKDVPTCSEWYAAYLKERGKGKCPAALPFYWENDNGESGCSEKINSDGNSPAEPTSPANCLVYPDEVRNMSKIDSCLNQTYKESAVCFTDPGITATKTLVPMGDGKQPALVACQYGTPGLLDESSGTCYTDESIVRNKKATIDAQNTVTGSTTTVAEWKATSADWNPLYKLNFCSVVQKYKVAKTASVCKTLSNDTVF
jgi:hypothetical protein